MALSILRLVSAPPSSSLVPSRSFDLCGKVNDIKKSVLSILKDTNWPKEASDDVQDFIQTVETQLALDKVLNEGKEAPERLKVALERLLNQLENAKARLKKEAQKYDPTKKGLRHKFRKLVSGSSPNECAEILRNCRDDVVMSSTALSDILKGWYAGSEQSSSRVAEGSVEDNSGGPVEGHGAQTASTPIKAEICRPI
ncbi:hypothetical protein FRC01_009444 [Tulasnella sp. 417]|nr:hypothetical protein FRC01_009444 [Tulasnella sp. 417]